jgi:hypothetical protein
MTRKELDPKNNPVHAVRLYIGDVMDVTFLYDSC